MTPPTGTFRIVSKTRKDGVTVYLAIVTIKQFRGFLRARGGNPGHLRDAAWSTPERARAAAVARHPGIVEE